MPRLEGEGVRVLHLTPGDSSSSPISDALSDRCADPYKTLNGGKR